MNCRNLELGDLKEIAALCDVAFQKNYHITEQKLFNNLFESHDFCRTASKVLTDENGKLIGFIGVKVSSNQELYPKTAWLSIMAVDVKKQKHGYGTCLLRESINTLKALQIEKVILGQDFANFFSGIPIQNEGDVSFFQKNGFQVNADSHYDLEADIVHNKKIDAFDITPWAEKYPVNIYSDEDKNKFLDFLNTEFPGRWVYEAEEALEQNKNNEEIILMWDRDKDKIVGYCMLTVDREKTGNVIGYGGLGPIGIAKQIRGSHVGDYILHQSLIQLRKLCVTTVNIDWTILEKFYGQFDFKIERTYRGGYILI